MAPIPAERCVAGRDLTEPRLRADGTVLVYAVSHDGVASLAVHDVISDDVRWIAQWPALRPGRGMGGGAWCYSADGESVIYTAVDGNLWKQSMTGSPAEALTDVGPEHSVSSPMATHDGAGVVFVVDLAEVHYVELVDRSTRRLDDGSNGFTMDPWAAPDGTVRWVAWDVPDMPWDRSRVRVRHANGTITDAVNTGRSVQQPRVLPDGRPIAVRDDDGWLNVWVADAVLVAEAFEHAGPSWGPGQRSYAWSPDGRSVAFTRNERGFGRLCVVEVDTGAVREVARGVHGQLSWAGDRLSAVRTGARTPTQVVLYNTRSWERAVVAVGPSDDWTPDELAEPEAIEVAALEGVVHGRLYRADDADGRMIVWLHGGPTDQWQVTFMPRVAYWRSRGWNILVPDHRGSTGHGREYQQALRRRWGVLDVADTLAITAHAHDVGWGQPSRTVVMGSSAGGFTALGAVAHEPRRFAAAVVLYPVTDLVDLAERSHRFERHYTDSLVGPLPGSEAIYLERSPGQFAPRCASTPLLVLHGDADAVVPVEQSLVFAERVRAAGGDIDLHVYPGEGHGFRQPHHQLDEYQRVADFLARCVPVASPP